MPPRPAARLLPLILAATWAAAQETGERPSKPAEPPLFRFVLSEGSRVTGKFSVPWLECETEFGRLQIPVEKLAQVVTGLNHRPERRAEIEQLVRRLGEGEPQRADARAELIALGPSIRILLRQQDRVPARAQLRDEVEHLVHHERRKPERGLVQHNETRL